MTIDVASRSSRRAVCDYRGAFAGFPDMRIAHRGRGRLGQITSRLTTALMACAFVLAFALPGAKADTVVHDPALEAIVDDGSYNMYEQSWNSLWKLNALAQFTGNGQPLERVGVYYGNFANGGAMNEAPYWNWKWRVHYYENLDAFLNNPENPTFQSPQLTPQQHAVNENWQDVLFDVYSPGHEADIDIRYLEVDVSQYEIMTTQGANHFVALVAFPGHSNGTALIPVTDGNGIGGENWAYFDLWDPQTFRLIDWPWGGAYSSTQLVTTSAPDPPCAGPADLNCDGVVDALDLLILLSEWGECADPSPGNCPADINGDGTVDALDLLELLSNWG